MPVSEMMLLQAYLLIDQRCLSARLRGLVMGRRPWLSEAKA